MNKVIHRLCMIGSFYAVYNIFTRTTVYAYALVISPNVKASDFDAYTIPQFQNMVLNLIFWILRMVGAVVLMWGVYGFITARKEGDADSINQAMVKFIFGTVFLCMPGLLKALKIII